jgi:hypothetical protein
MFNCNLLNDVITKPNFMTQDVRIVSHNVEGMRQKK